LTEVTAVELRQAGAEAVLQLLEELGGAVGSGGVHGTDSLRGRERSGTTNPKPSEPRPSGGGHGLGRILPPQWHAVPRSGSRRNSPDSHGTIQDAHASVPPSAAVRNCRSLMRHGCLYCSIVPPLRLRRSRSQRAQKPSRTNCRRSAPRRRLSRLDAYSTFVSRSRSSRRAASRSPAVASSTSPRSRNRP